MRERFPFVGRVYATPRSCWPTREVRIVDIATAPAGRLDWVEAARRRRQARARAEAAGRRRRPSSPRLPACSRGPRRAGVRVAVNQNGRWAPPWRLATLLVRAGAVGDVVGVTHLHDKPLPPLAGTPFDDVAHMLVTDYLVHWIDITRCWLEPGAVTARVRAFDSRVPGQPRGVAQPVVGHGRPALPTAARPRSCG